MSDYILHHFDPSPFAEKVRKIFGLKGLAWRSVIIPMVPPKPDLTALTGGYRKTPTLQIGADIYCDTQLIAREIEARAPQPTLYPNGPALALGSQLWTDGPFFQPGAGLSLVENAPHLPDDLLQDRKAYFTFLDFDNIDQETPHLRGQFRAHAALLDRQLQDGRAFLGGAEAGWADLNAYHVIWMARGNIPSSAQFLAPFERLAAWEARVKALGEGERTEIDADEALRIARESEPAAARGVDADDPLGLSSGQAVEVAADDYGKDPVAGALVTLTSEEIAVRRTAPRAGEVVVHFPRIGFQVTPR